LLPVSAYLRFPASFTTLAYTPGIANQKEIPTTLPSVDPEYIYNQLFYMGTHFLRREAGYDNNLPPAVNGHDEFAAYWTQEMMKNLQGFGAQVRRDPFTVQGWVGRPATVPAVNVEVSVPGITRPAVPIRRMGCRRPMID